MKMVKILETGAPLACETPATGMARDIARKIAARVPVLETERLCLRAPVTEDFALFHEILRGPRGQYFGPMSREDAWLDFAQMAAGWILRGHGVWTIEDRATTETLGFVLLGLDQEDPEPELGFLISEAAEGRGIAFEAAQAARDFAFDTLGWPTLVSFVTPGNDRSIALALRLGAVADGQVQHPDDDGPTLVFRHTPKPTKAQEDRNGAS